MIDPNQLDGQIQKSSGGADNRSTVSGGSGGTASAASATASAASTSTAGKQRIVANNVGNIRTTNERFLYLFKEGIKHFRIP